MQQDVKSKDDMISDLQQRLNAVQADYQNVVTQASEEQKTVSAQMDDTIVRLRDCMAENAQIRQINEKFKADYLQLRELCEQMKNANGLALNTNERLKSDNILLTQRVERLMSQLEIMDKKLLQYEQNNAQFVSEIGRLKSVSQELNRRLNDSEENISYKERYNELSQKVMSTQNEISSLKDILDDEQQRRDKLESAIHELATIDFSVFDSASSQLTDLIGASQSIKSTVFSALEKCGELSDESADKQKYSAIKYNDNDALVHQMNEQIEQVSSMLSNDGYDRFSEQSATAVSAVDADNQFSQQTQQVLAADDTKIDENEVEANAEFSSDSTPLDFSGEGEQNTEEQDF